MKHRYVTAALLVLVILSACERATGPDDGEGSHGHGHEHPAGASDGVIARLTDAKAEEDVGYLRLKLHDDKGDLEAWIARDVELSEPLDLPLDTTITVTFVDKDGRSVELRVRNREENEDEDGKGNIRDGKTNYFIFPGDSGEDASWLQGAEFLSTTKVSFSASGTDYATPAFILRPHTHGDGHSH